MHREEQSEAPGGLKPGTEQGARLAAALAAGAAAGEPEPVPAPQRDDREALKSPQVLRRRASSPCRELPVFRAGGETWHNCSLCPLPGPFPVTWWGGCCCGWPRAGCCNVALGRTELVRGQVVTLG